MPEYASAADLDTYSPNLNHPDDLATYVRAASRLVARATRRAVYVVNGSDLPTDAAVSGAMRDAVCEQIVQWVRAGVDPGGTVAQPTTVTARTTTSGPRTVTEQYASGPGVVTPVSADYLHPAALGILGDAGLLGGVVLATRGGAW